MLFSCAGLTALDIRNDSQTVCTGSEDATARLVNLQTGRVLGALAGKLASPAHCLFLPYSFVHGCSLGDNQNEDFYTAKPERGF